MGGALARGSLRSAWGWWGAYSTARRTNTSIPAKAGSSGHSDDPKRSMARADDALGQLTCCMHATSPRRRPRSFEQCQIRHPQRFGPDGSTCARPSCGRSCAGLPRIRLRAGTNALSRWSRTGLRGYARSYAGHRPTPKRKASSAPPSRCCCLDWSEDGIAEVIKRRCAARGVELKWFGGAEPVAFTSRYDSWRYAPSAPMPAKYGPGAVRASIDMRLPLTFSLEDCAADRARSSERK